MWRLTNLYINFSLSEKYKIGSNDVLLKAQQHVASKRLAEIQREIEMSLAEKRKLQYDASKQTSSWHFYVVIFIMAHSTVSIWALSNIFIIKQMRRGWSNKALDEKQYSVISIFLFWNCFYWTAKNNLKIFGTHLEMLGVLALHRFWNLSVVVPVYTMSMGKRWKNIHIFES